MSINFYKIPTFLLISLLSIGVLVVSCEKDDNAEPDIVELLSFGPSPALRGGELKIIGKNLDRVTSVILPQNVQVTSFASHTNELITLTIPQETLEGKIVLKSSDGDITSQTLLTISEPIIFTSFSPAVIRAGELLTITGDYLNLISTVIFHESLAVGDTMFTSQTREKIELFVPDRAQSGPVFISTGGESPIIVESEEELEVTIPKISAISPNPVKAGSMLTIDGTDLDLTMQIGFEGAAAVTDFVSQSPTKIEVIVPDNAQDGPVVVVPASFLEIPSAESLVMVVPQISGVSPNPVKNGQKITVTGIDLDLISRVTFGGNKIGAILGGGTDTEITVKVPISAEEDYIQFKTRAEKIVPSDEILTLIKPNITGFDPPEAEFGAEISIQGEDMDLVTDVIFSGGVQVGVNNATQSAATVDVPMWATSGPVTVITTNGSQITSTMDFRVAVSILAVITDMPALASLGEMISIVGTDLDEISELIFPEEVPATMFGQKSATLIEVFVPTNAAIGVGNIKFITLAGEEFFSPPINLQGVDMVDDPELVFFNFDGLDSWWGDAGAVENDPDLSLDGSNYFRVNEALSGWNGLFWRNGGDNFPGAKIGTNISEYALKFDIQVLDPITGGILQWRLQGTEGDFWNRWAPWEESGSFSTNGWITVTIPLITFTDDFGNGTLTLTDLNSVTNDFGLAFNDGDSQVNICIDNVRFEKL
jgi:hypothetical protein